MPEWHYASGGTRYGPVSWEELRGLAEAGRLQPDDLVWKKGMSGWATASAIAHLMPEREGPPPLPSSDNWQVGKDRLTAGLLAILLGSLGVHKFMLGMTKQGVIMLLCSLLSCGILAPAMHIIGLIEGLIYLSKSDAEFDRIYVVGQRPWF